MIKSFARIAVRLWILEGNDLKFENSCQCIVDCKILEKAIIEECGIRGIIPKDSYKIYNYRGYAGLSLKHDKVSVHRILGKYMAGFNFGSEIHVHHIDKNRFNNNISNLQVIRNDLHTKEHYIVQYVSGKHKKEFGNRMKDYLIRKDVTIENVAELRNKGLTIPEISKELNCGINTVNRRLGMKDY